MEPMKFDLPHIKPGRKTREAMARAAHDLGERACCAGENGYTKDCIKAITRLTGHKRVKLLSSGNCAIMAIARAINGKIMVPDQGGWRGFIQYPETLGLEVCKISTDLGLIDIETLEDALEKENPLALFITSFAGYMAEQNIKEISRVCRDKGVFLMEDASGAIGDKILARGKYSDAIVASTGTPKPVNLVTGGLLSTDDKRVIESGNEIIKACKMNPVTAAGLPYELEYAKDRIMKLIEYSNIVKQEIPESIHQDYRGISVGIAAGKDPRKILNRASESGLKTSLGKSLLTATPLYDRFMEKGIVLELKKLDITLVPEDDIVAISRLLQNLLF